MQAPRETVGRAKVLDTERKHTEKQRIHVTEKRRILNCKGGRETDQVSLFASADTAVPPWQDPEHSRAALSQACCSLNTTPK